MTSDQLQLAAAVCRKYKPVIIFVSKHYMHKPLLRLFLILAIHHLLLTAVSAQQDAQYSMYRFNGLYINPAYAGSHEY
jgi:hypothetical protein